MALLGSVILGAGVLVGIFIGFSIARKKLNTFYAYKSHEKELWAPPHTSGWFGWIAQTWTFKDEDLFKHPGGYDAFSYLLMLRYSVRFFVFLSVIGLLSAIPTNWSGTLKDLPNGNPRKPSDPFDLWTLANIDGDELDNRLIVHLFLVIIFSGAGYFMLYKMFQNFSGVNHARLRNETLEARTIMVHNLPKGIVEEDHLEKLFEEVYGERITDIVVMKDSSKCRNLAEKRKSYFQEWKLAKHYEAQTGERKVITTKKKGLPVGQPVDAIHHWERKVRKYDALLQKAVDNLYLEKKPENKLKNSENSTTSTPPASPRLAALKSSMSDVGSNSLKIASGSVGRARHLLKLNAVGIGFVSMDSLAIAMQAAQTLQLSNPKKLECSMAPDPSDIAWNWMGKSERELWIRQLLVTAALVALFTFWTIPVAAISAISRLDELAKVPGLDALVAIVELNPIVQSIVEGLLPSLALIIFMAILPIILKLLLNQRAFHLLSDLDKSVIITYWLFLLLNVFLVVSIAGSIWGVLDSIISDPSIVVSLLGNSLPQQSIFFANYIITNATISVPLLLFDIGGVVVSTLKKKLAKTKYAKRLAELPVDFNYRVVNAQVCLMFTIGLVYSTMAPFISAYCSLYFAVAYLVHKHNLTYHNVPLYSGLVLTPTCINLITVALILYELTMCGLFGLKSFAAGSIICAVLAGITLLFRLYLEVRWGRSSIYLPLQMCPPTTHKIREQRHNDDDIHAMYVDPATVMARPIEFEKEEILPEMSTIKLDVEKKKKRKELGIQK